MARTIATIGGVGLAPGISRNRRLYTAEHIAGAVATAQERLTKGDQPMVMLSHHEAGDDSLRIAAALRSVSVAEDGRIRWGADIPDTTAGREIAALADTSDGKPAFLEGVSIRGHWTGRVRKVKGPDGEPVETAEGLELDGLDFTHKPGVPEARIDTFAWTKGGTSETSELVPITESAEAHLTAITEETSHDAGLRALTAGSDGAREVLRTIFGAGPELVTEGGNAPGDGSKPYGSVSYADPGYQKDGQKRYPLNNAARTKSAWSYINQAKNAGQYTAAQLKRIKGRIKAAAGKFGITIASEGWTIDPALQITEAVTEFMGGDPGSAGSYSLTATNGPTTVTVCSYGLDPADLAVILQKACEGAGMALAALDPDMDADIDIPGDDDEDTESADTGGDGISDLATRLAAALKGESTEDVGELIEMFAEARNAGGVVETAPASQDPATGAGPNPREEPAVSEATTTEAVPAPAAPTAPAIPSQDVIDAAVTKALAADREARKARKAAKAQAAPPAESAPAAEATVTETADERVARLVAEKLTAINAPSASAVAESEAQRVERLVNEALVREKQALTVNGGGPSRKGLVTEHTAAAAAAGETPPDLPFKDGKITPMEQWGEAEYRAVGRVWQDHVLGDRAVY